MLNWGNCSENQCRYEVFAGITLNKSPSISHRLLISKPLSITGWVILVLCLVISPSLIAGLVGESPVATNNLPAASNNYVKPVYSQQQFGNYHALIIGINNYAHLPRLRTSINDARVISQILADDYQFNVTYLKDSERNDILRALNQYRDSLTNNDNLLIYYAGHGLLDEAANDGYWLPKEAKADDPLAWISNMTITQSIRAIRAKHVMVIADSCYAGTLTRGIKAENRLSKYLEKLVNSRTRTALVSGGLEPVDDGVGQHSPFAKALIRALKNNIGILEATELYTKVRRQVMLNSDQIPQYNDIRKAGHEGGDFLFVHRNLFAEPEPQMLATTTQLPEKSEFAVFSESDKTKPAIAAINQNYTPESSALIKQKFAKIQWQSTQNGTTIAIRSNPENANVYINGIQHGLTPYTLETRGLETLFIELEKEGYQRWQTTLASRDNQSAALNINLQALIQDTLANGSAGPIMLEIPGEGLDTTYAIGKYEVTFAEYDLFAKATGRTLPDDEGWGRGERPVFNVSWEDAQAYAQWLSQQTGSAYRLPTEAEWEYSARGGSAMNYPWGNTIGQNRANCSGCSDTWVVAQPQLTGSFAANAFGLHDVIGNLQEWTASCNKNLKTHPIQAKPPECESLIVKGGNWQDTPEKITLNAKRQLPAHVSNNKLGFRLVKELDQQLSANSNNHLN